MNEARPHDTKEYRKKNNADKAARRAKNPQRYIDYEEMKGFVYQVYMKSPNGLTQMTTVEGTRSKQVQARQTVRAQMKVSADQIILFSGGRMLKTGVSM